MSDPALPRKEFNNIGAHNPKVGDEWHERVYIHVGTVTAVYLGRFVIYEMSSGIRYLTLKEYIALQGYREDFKSTYGDLTRAKVETKTRATPWALAKFFWNRRKAQIHKKFEFAKTYKFMGLNIRISSYK